MENKAEYIVEQPDPIKNNYPPMWDLVIKDMKDRDEVGRERYGVPLQPFNGRDMLVDAYLEVLDLAVYLRTAIFEQQQYKEELSSTYKR